ncbi:MAG: restriction endonuclease subunit S [Bacteroidales bacterium]|nr:restriction endonuclease subunit S [Bacteroidales bacterium]
MKRRKSKAMGLKKYKLGELIELVEETNSRGMYGPKDVRGMTITKEIIPTKADVANTDLRKFLVVHPDEFVFNPRTHGKKIGFGYNNTKKCFLISWNNIAFRVKSDALNTVIPSYLFLHFNREEWDREACFCSWGSSTEVFSWDALCDMKLTLPSIEQQRKYVDVYLALQNNLAAYQSKVEELKMVCDGYLDKLKVENQKLKIGEFIEQYDRRNIDDQLSLNSVKGISTEKSFIDTKADMNGVSLTSYKVVEANTFVYVPDTSRRGDKMAIALNRDREPILVSSIYTTFKSKDTSKLLPEYLFMFFDRPEFDRYARFNSWGSAREVFTMDDMNDVKIPIPDISVQREIINIHKCYIECQRIAEALKEQLKNICPVLIRGSLTE